MFVAEVSNHQLLIIAITSAGNNLKLLPSIQYKYTYKLVSKQLNNVGAIFASTPCWCQFLYDFFLNDMKRHKFQPESYWDHWSKPGSFLYIYFSYSDCTDWKLLRWITCINICMEPTGLFTIPIRLFVFWADFKHITSQRHSLNAYQAFTNAYQSQSCLMIVKFTTYEYLT